MTDPAEDPAAEELIAASPAEAPEACETGGRSGARVLLGLLALIPITFWLDGAGADRALVFVTAVLAMIPLAGFLGRATEEIAIRSNPAAGALLNATFGNAVEVLIAARLLLGDDPAAPDIVRASLVGSVVTNLLLLVGLSALAGGLKYKEQRFNKVAVGISSSLLIIAFAGVSIPTIFGHFLVKTGAAPADRLPQLSRAVSVILALVYLGGVAFTFVTHRHLFDTTDELRVTRKPEWPLSKAIAVLGGTLVVVAWLAGVLESTLSVAGQELGLTKTFVGVVVIGVITNVAENLSAIAYARKNLIDLSIQIGASSAIQIILFVVPLLVLLGACTGHSFILQFTLFELACMLLPVMITNHLAADGVCNWLEGLQLIALYAIIGTAFYFVP